MSSPPTTSTPLNAPANRRWRILAVQFGLLAAVTVVLTALDVDRRVAAHFYHPDQGWFLDKEPLWRWLHAYGTIPGILMTLAALLVWLAGFYMRALARWRRPCLVVVLTTFLAAGLLVNAVLKQYWGRPRPSQTIEFGGKWEYSPIFPPGTPGKGASFPCGHCTMGFVFLAMAAFRRQSKALAYGGVAAGVVLGVLLSAARVVQGAHFVGDTIWSLGIVGMTATALALYLPRPEQQTAGRRSKPVSPWTRAWITIGVMTAAVAMIIGFMTRRPYYNTMIYPLDLPASVASIHIRINQDPESVSVRFEQRNDGRLKVDAHGFGWLKFDYQMGFGTRVEQHTLNITLHVEARSYFAELDHALALTLPANAKGRVKVLLNQQTVQSLGSTGAPSNTALPTVASVAPTSD